MLNKYGITFEYLEGLTSRVNKIALGESIEWLMGIQGDFLLRKDDIAHVNMPFAVGYLYNHINGQFLELNGSLARHDAYKKFDYMGGELRFMNSKYDITDWLNEQRWNGTTMPSGKCIIIGWLIKNKLLGLMAYKEWLTAELNLVDSCGDDLIIKLSGN